MSDVTHCTQSVSLMNDLIDFGIVDEKGRAIGARKIILRETYAPGRDRFGCGFHGIAPGVQYRVYVQPTRNGRKFGAITPDAIVANVVEAVRVADKKVAGSRARYLRKYGTR